MPVIKSNRFEFVVNVKTIKALNLTLQPQIPRPRRRDDRVSRSTISVPGQEPT